MRLADQNQNAQARWPIVELRYATLPAPLGLVAVHYWFVVFDAEHCKRWEVWQTKDAGGSSVGHIHCDLKRPDEGVGGGPMRIAQRWAGRDARAIAEVLEQAGTRYPHAQRYLAWPGPNSNTFVAWTLRCAGVRVRLSWKALGHRYRTRGAG
ncbi:MAG: DUF3750 domain-containing protein [Pseudomonadota bacterium]|nr:DUF3750 domain-containing protein [Pseudomonadota bacterium]